jgi:hypothetical protein
VLFGFLFFTVCCSWCGLQANPAATTVSGTPVSQDLKGETMSFLQAGSSLALSTACPCDVDSLRGCSAMLTGGLKSTISTSPTFHT